MSDRRERVRAIFSEALSRRGQEREAYLATACGGDDELRAEGIEGGEARRLSAGDVVVVPRGTPHWFREVETPMTYYVVKVR